MSFHFEPRGSIAYQSHTQIGHLYLPQSSDVKSDLPFGRQTTERFRTRRDNRLVITEVASTLASRLLSLYVYAADAVADRAMVSAHAIGTMALIMFSPQ